MPANRFGLAAAFLFAATGAAEAQTFPAAGIDEFNITMIVSLYSDTACSVMGEMRLPVGVIALKRGVPTDPGDGLDEVPLEIVSLSLADETLLITEAPGGSDPDDAGDPPCTVGAASADGGSGCSPGTVKAQQVSPDLPATMHLELYLEVTEGGTTRFNKVGVPLAGASGITALPLALGAVAVSGAGCAPLYDTADPFGPAVGSVATLGFITGPATAVPSTALKLVLLDKPGAAPDKMVFKSVHSTLGAPCDLQFPTIEMTVSYDAAIGTFTVPSLAFDGTAGWTSRSLPNNDLTCRYRNGQAPAGASATRSVRFGPFKVVARSLGDVPIDLVGAGAPSGTVSVITHITSGEWRTTHCTEFAGCIYAPITGGGAKLKCSNGTPAPTCVPVP